MSDSSTPDVFISHSSEDDADVSRFDKTMRVAGFNVWVDHEEDSIEVGTQSFDQKIQAMLNACLQPRPAVAHW